jgi:chromosome segregation ATPase
MKKFILLSFIGLLALYCYPTRPDSRLSGIKNIIFASFQSTQKSDANYQEELQKKNAELKAWEDGIVKFDETIRKLEANAPICPITGQKQTLVVTKDPRPEMQEKITKLKEEIELLESKMNDQK